MLLSKRTFDAGFRLLYLASQSPRRRQLLEQIGLRFGTVEVDVPEVRMPDEPPEDYVSRVAREKAGAGLLQLSGVARPLCSGADTEVVLDDEVFGKPADRAHAIAMLRRLSGRTHRVDLGGLVRERRARGACLEHHRSDVCSLSRRRFAAYVDSGESTGQGGCICDAGSRGGVRQHLRAAIRA